MPDQPKTPLKVGQSGCNFHRKLSLYQRMILYRTGQLESYFRNSNFRGGGPPYHPSGGRCQVCHNIVNLKSKFNFMHILIINEDILGTFGALHVESEIIPPKYCSKYSQKLVISTGIRISGYPNPEYLPESEITYPSTRNYCQYRPLWLTSTDISRLHKFI